MYIKLRILCFLLITLFGFGGHSTLADDEPASVEGRITTLWGASIGDVKISFYLLEGIAGNSKSEKLVQEVTTDKQGSYKVTNLPWGQYRIIFSNSFGHTEIWRYRLWRDAKRVLDISLPIGYQHYLSPIQVSGLIQQSDGLPIEDATVSMISAFNPNDYQQTRTDKSGKYQFRKIQPGQYIICASKQGFLVGSTAVDLGNGEEQVVSITLKIGKAKGPFPEKQ